jgi:hypothetical protein
VGELKKADKYLEYVGFLMPYLANSTKKAAVSDLMIWVSPKPHIYTTYGNGHILS